MEPPDFCKTSVIQNALSSQGFHFSKAKGQNFLINANVPKRMAELVPEGSGVLEIGPGFGALTAALCLTAEKVLALEVDKRLVGLLRENLSGRDNLVLLEQDALKANLPELFSEHFQGLVPMAVCNLPYSLTSELLTLLIQTRELASFIVMVQKEVAMRLCAAPDTPEYGSFSVFSQVYGQADILFDVSPGSFIPAPSVTSAVFRWTRRQQPLVPDDLQKAFFKTVRGSFSQRRKTLRNALSAALSLDKDTLSEAFETAGIDGIRRGETLSISEFLKLTKEIEEQRRR